MTKRIGRLRLILSKSEHHSWAYKRPGLSLLLKSTDVYRFKVEVIVVRAFAVRIFSIRLKR